MGFEATVSASALKYSVIEQLKPRLRDAQLKFGEKE